MLPDDIEKHELFDDVVRLRKEFSLRQAAPFIIDLLQTKLDKDLSEGRVNDSMLIQYIASVRKLMGLDAIRPYVDKAFEIKPHSPHIAREKLNILIADKEYDQASDIIEVLESKDATRVYGLQERAKLLREVGKVTEAINVLENAVENEGIQSPILRYEAGVLIKYYNNDLERAIGHFRVGLALNPEDLSLKEILAVSLVDQADTIVDTDYETATVMREEALQLLNALSDKNRKHYVAMIDYLGNAISGGDVKKRYRRSYDANQSVNKQRGKGSSKQVSYNTSLVEERAAYIAKYHPNGQRKALKFLIDSIKEDDVRPPSLLEKAASYALRIGYYDLASDLTKQSLETSGERSQSLHLRAIALMRRER